MGSNPILSAKEKSSRKTAFFFGGMKYSETEYEDVHAYEVCFAHYKVTLHLFPNLCYN